MDCGPSRPAVVVASLPRLVCLWVLSTLVLLAGLARGEPTGGLLYDPDLEVDRPLASEFYGVNDYLGFPHQLGPVSAPLKARELSESLGWMWRDGDQELALGTYEELLGDRQLRAELSSALGLTDLLLASRQHSLRFAVLDEHYAETHLEQLLLFEDFFVGRFAARLLLPYERPEAPVVLALPGHDRDVYEFCVEFACGDYLAAGFAVAVLQLRADESSHTEHRTAAYLLAAGFNLAGLHVYEALLLTRYLRELSSLAPEAVVLLGHSGGAVLAALLSALEPSYAGAAIDTTAMFTEDMSGGLLCSSSHLLYPHHPQLSALEERPEVTLYEYGFPEGNQAVLAFFHGVSGHLQSLP
ncbi:MAG: hypothetical protein CMP23_03400 [Rickettsiales bacterium]|nr:hypothetical protein [Rickettsiales bacterium]